MKLRRLSSNFDGSLCEKLDADGPPRAPPRAAGRAARSARTREKLVMRSVRTGGPWAARCRRTARGHGYGRMLSHTQRHKSSGRTAVPRPAEPPSLSLPPPPPLTQPPSLARSPPAFAVSPCGRSFLALRPPSLAQPLPSLARQQTPLTSRRTRQRPSLAVTRPPSQPLVTRPGPPPSESLTRRRALRVPHHRHGSDPSRCSGQTDWDSAHGARPAARALTRQISARA